MEHYKGVMEADKKKQKKQQKKKQFAKKKKPVHEGFQSGPPKPIKIEKLNNLQPHYESKLDTIYKRIEDRYDNSEHKLAEDYNRVYNEYLEEEKKKSLNINPIQALTDFEESIYDIIDGKPKNKYDTAYIRKVYPGNIGSYFDRDTIPAKGVDVTEEVSRTDPPLPTSDQKDVIEGFEDSVDEKDKIDDNKDESSIKKLKRKKDSARPKDEKKSEKKGITLDSLLTGDTISNILQFGLDNTGDILGNVDISSSSIGNFASKEENMMPMGMLMIIASLMLYFADLSA